MYPARGRFGNAVDRVRFFSSHPNFDDAWIVPHELAHGFTPYAPHTGQFADTVMLLERAIFNHSWPAFLGPVHRFSNRAFSPARQPPRRRGRLGGAGALREPRMAQ